MESDPACFTPYSKDSSGIVTEKAVEYTERPDPRQDAAGPQVPTTSDEALGLAVKLAVDAGEYERAAAVLELLRRTAASGTVRSLARDERG